MGDLTFISALVDLAVTKGLEELVVRDVVIRTRKPEQEINLDSLMGQASSKFAVSDEDLLMKGPNVGLEELLK